MACATAALLLRHRLGQRQRKTRGHGSGLARLACSQPRAVDGTSDTSARAIPSAPLLTLAPITVADDGDDGDRRLVSHLFAPITRDKRLHRRARPRAHSDYAACLSQSLRQAHCEASTIRGKEREQGQRRAKEGRGKERGNWGTRPADRQALASALASSHRLPSSPASLARHSIT